MHKAFTLFLTVVLFDLWLCPVQAGNEIPAFVSFQPSGSKKLEPKIEFDVFLISTEMQIGKIKGLVERAPEGAYVTVGAERGFRGASMAPHITHLFLMDILPDIHRFNRINAELLKTPTRQAYRHLRWQASYEGWMSHKQTVETQHAVTVQLDRADYEWWVKRVRNLDNMSYPLPEVLNKDGYWLYPKKFSQIRNKLVRTYKALAKLPEVQFTQKELLTTLSRDEIQAALKNVEIASPLTEEEWNWWFSWGRDEKKVCSKLWLKHPEQAIDLGAVLDFKAGNYLFDDKLYQRLHKLALANRITIIDIDLASKEQLAKMVSFLKQNNQGIGVLDLNNLMFSGYLGQQNYRKILEHFLPLGKQDSVLIAMENYKDYACAQFQIYIGFTFENVKHWDSRFKLQTFIENLPDEVYPLIDQKLFAGEEVPSITFGEEED